MPEVRSRCLALLSDPFLNLASPWPLLLLPSSRPFHWDLLLRILEHADNPALAALGAVSFDLLVANSPLLYTDVTVKSFESLESLFCEREEGELQRYFRRSLVFNPHHRLPSLLISSDSYSLWNQPFPIPLFDSKPSTSTSPPSPETQTPSLSLCPPPESTPFPSHSTSFTSLSPRTSSQTFQSSAPRSCSWSNPLEWSSGKLNKGGGARTALASML
ncbi:hypothetical protein BDY24DRAFT_404725 [Mrakia frigida]|uniref:uncharacterized protein n=1 Tax=Mrakia frigida TaxID=29902 RepID=UPI003FCC0C95